MLQHSGYELSNHPKPPSDRRGTTTAIAHKKVLGTNSVLRMEYSYNASTRETSAASRTCISIKGRLPGQSPHLHPIIVSPQ